MAIRYRVKLTAEERKRLFEFIREGKASQERLNRAKILLKVDQGEEGENWEHKKIAEAFYVSEATVGKVCKSLVEDGFEEVLKRKEQANRKRKMHGEEEARLVTLACSQAPEGHARWTLRLLADKMVELNYVESISHETIRQTLKKTKLSPGKKRSGVSLQRKTQNSSVEWKNF